MNSAVKQYPRYLSRLVGRWTALAALLMALPALGQVTVKGDKAVNIVDATQIPGSNDSQASKADPYPAILKVGDKIGDKTVQGKIQRIAVKLPSLSHSYLADLDVLLVNPTGVPVILASDVGVGLGVSGDITISPAASTGFPEGGTPGALLTPGSYKPTDFAPAENGTPNPFEAPAPAGPYGTDLGVYANGANSSNIKGEWKLFIMDDRKFDAGTSGAPELQLWLSPVTSVTNTTVEMVEDTPFIIPVTIEDTDTPVSDLKLEIVDGSLVNGNLIDKTNVFVGSPTGNVWPVTFSPKAHANGTVKLGLKASDKLGSADTIEVTVNVAARNDAPTVGAVKVGGTETNIVKTAQGELSPEYTVALGDIDSDTAQLTISGVSGNTNIVLSTDLLSSGPGANPTFRIAPKGAEYGTTTFSIIAKDAEGSNSAPKTVTFEVAQRTDRKVIANYTPIAITESTTESSKSEITLSDYKAKVAKVRVTLADISHANPEQLDVVLVGPTGAKVALLGQAGGANALSRVRLTFDDGGSVLPDDSQITTGTYKPTDYSPADPLPGLAGPYANSLSEFIDTDPNGKWTLYAVDRTAGTVGAINGGFIIEVFTKPVIATIAAQTVDEDSSAFNVPVSVGDLDGTVKTLTAQAISDDAGTPEDDRTMATIAVSPAFVADSTSGTIKITPNANRWGKTTVRVTISDNAGYVTTTDFVLTINSVNDQPTISPVNKQVTYIGLPAGPATFTISDVENPGGGAPVTVTARSSNTKLLPEGNIVIGGAGNNRTVTLFPVGLDPGTVDVTLTVKDNDPAGSKESSTTFRLDVSSPATPLFVNQSKIIIQDTGAAGGATNALGSPFLVQVKDLVGKIQKVKVNLVGLKHPRPQDLDILLVGPDNTGVVLLSDAGGTDFANSAQLLFSQDAAGQVSAGGIASGTFLPTDLEGSGNDYFNSPFAVPGYPAGVTVASGLDAFANKNPNGNWQLYVIDDTGNTKEPDSVIEGGWMLHIQTSPVFSSITPNPAATTEDKAVDFSIDIGDNQPGVPTTFRVVSTTNPDLVDNSRVTFSEGGDIRKMTINPKADASGTATLVIGVTIGGEEATQSLTLNVTPVNDDPSISEIANKSVLAGLVLGPFDFTVSDKESAATAITVEASSSDPRLPSGNLVLGGTGATRTLTILPAATTESFSSVITVTASDPNGGKFARSFTYTANRSLSFSSSDNIAIQDNSAARPYPSKIQVKGVNGLVSKAYVTVRGFSHSFPDDVHLLLVKGDKKMVLMGNAGGPAPLNGVSNLILGFDDGAANALPDETKLASGAYKPANYGTPNLPSPAPAGPYGTTLSTFNLIDPNGDWDLYVFDDTFSDDGSISGGWTLIIETAPEIVAISNQVGVEDVTLPVTVEIRDADTEAAKITSTAVSLEDGGTIVVASTNAVFDPATTNQFVRTLNIKPQADVSGNVTNTIRVTVSDGTTTVNREFKVSFAPVNDVPNIGTDTNLVVIAEDTLKEITFYIDDVDSVLDKTNAVASSDNQTLLPDKNITIAGPTGLPAGSKSTLLVTVKPEPNAYGEALVTVRINDKHPSNPQVGARALLLRVTPVNDIPTITSIASTNVTAGSTVRDIPIRVVDVSEPPPQGETEAKNLVVTAKSDNQAVVPDSNLVISQSGTNRLLSVTTIGGTKVPVVVKLSLEVSDTNGGKAQTQVTLTVDPTEPDPANTFVKTDEITIKDKANADPYPLVLNIPGGTLKGKIFKVEVVVDGLSHTAPDDVDILLEHGGKSVILMSDAGGRIAAVNSRLTFSDSATQALRDDGPIAADGTYVPSNYAGDVDSFPGAGGGTPEATLAAAFAGLDPNGDWKLYVVDDQANDTGKIAKGFAIRITTTPTIRRLAGAEEVLKYNEDTVANPTALSGGASANPDVEIADADAGTSAAGLTITTRSSDESIIKSSSIVLTGALGAGGYDVNITPERDRFDESTNVLTTITVTRKSDGASSSVTFKNAIIAVNDAPDLTRTSDKIIEEDETAETVFVVIDPAERNPNDPIELEARSVNAAAVGNSNIVLNGVAGAVNGASVKVQTTVGAQNTIVIRPNKDAAAGGPVSTLIEITATDSSTTPPAKLKSTPRDQFGRYLVTIKPKNDSPTLASIPDLSITSGQTKIWDVADGNFPAVIDVADPDDNADITVTATSRDQNLVKNANIKITPEKGGIGKRDLLITSELQVEGDVTIDLVVTDKQGGTSGRSFKLSVRPSRERRFDGKNIAINDLAPGNPYPSIIDVNSLVGDVSNVRVVINKFQHGYPDDVDMVLESPTGTKVMLMSDAGGSTPVTNITLEFSQTGGSPVSDLGPLASAVVRPANWDIANDPFQGGPVGPFETDLTKFNGKSAKGEWKLYVVDDTRQDAGNIESWSLYITTQPRIEGLANQSIKEDDGFTAPFTIVEESFAPNSFTFGFDSTNSAVIPVGNLSVSDLGGGNYQVVGKPALDASGQSKITVFATNTFAQVVNASFLVTVSAVDDQPTITQVADQLVSSGEATPPVPFDYGDAETAKKDVKVEIFSTNPDLVPTNNVIQIGNTLTIAPVGNKTGTTEITIRVTDSANQSAKTTFTVGVVPALNAQYANTNVITIRDNQSAQPYPSIINVAGLKAKISKVTVTLAQVSHPYPADIDVLLVSPSGKKVVLMSDAGGGRRIESGRYTFDDAATNSLPYNPAAPITGGSYKPTNHEGTSDTFPSPAPAGPYAATLSAFAGEDPIGDWSLYVVDDVSPDSGAITGGWILNIFTTEPVISEIGDVTTDENVPVIVHFQVNDADTPLTSVTTVAGTDRPGLIQVGTVQGTGKDRTVRIDPVAFQNGSATVEVIANDGTTLVSRTFGVTVRPVNQAPQILGLVDASTPANRVLSLPFIAFDQETAGAELTASASVERGQFGSAEVPAGGNNRTLIFRPSGQQGQTPVSVVVSDGVYSTTNTINITVGADYALTISAIPDQVVNEDAAKTVSFTVSGSESGNVEVVGTSADTNIIASVKTTGAGASWSAILTPKLDAVGSTTIALLATDEFGTGTNTFNVTVVAANDPPVFGPIPNQNTLRNQNVTFEIPVTDIDTAVDALVYTWATSNPDLVNNVVFGFKNGTVPIATVFPKRDQVGQASITIFADDGTTKVGAPVLLTVTAPANEPPVFGPIADQETIKNIPLTIDLPITDSDTPVADILMTAVSSDESVVKNVLFGIKNGTTITATLRPVSGATGSTRITLTANDGDSTRSQSFNLTVKDTPNEPPVFGKIPDQTTTENKNVTIVLDVTDSDTAVSKLVFGYSTSNAELVTAVSVDATGASPVATVVLGKNKTGLAVVTITVNDGANTVQQSFALQVDPAPAPKLAKPTVTHNPDGTFTVVVTWEDGGELEWAPGAAGPWTKTGNTSGRYTEVSSQGSKVFRVVR